MPKILHHLTCSILVAVVGAGAAFADTGIAPPAAPSMSEEMLRVWQMRDVIDAAPLSVQEFDAAGAADADADEALPSSAWRLEPQSDGAPVSSTGITTSTGGSMTPNLDRLMQRTYQPLVPSDAPGVTSTATPAPWDERSFSKSGSTSLDGKKKNNRSGRNNGGNHGGGNHYGGNRYNGGYNCSHSHHGGCGGHCGHPHCHNPGKNDNHGGHGGGHGGGGGGGGGDCDPPTPTPEPATLLLFGAAAAAAGVRKRRQRN